MYRRWRSLTQLMRWRIQLLATALLFVVLTSLGIAPLEAAPLMLIGMAAPADYLDTADLRAVAYQGLVNEDVMQKIWNIDPIPLPFTDLVGVESCSNSYCEWTEDGLATPDVTNAVVSGSDASGNDAATGSRRGNHCQIGDKVVATTLRAAATDQIGRSDEHAYQLMLRQQELRRDLEAICLNPQASVADDNNTTPGKLGSLPAQVVTNDTGTATGFNTTTGLFAVPTAGTAAGATMANLKTLIQNAYINNGDITVLMSRPLITASISEFLLTSAANVATPTANVGGQRPTAQAAQGYVNVMITDFGTTLDIVPNRLQQEYNSGANADLFLLDPSTIALVYLTQFGLVELANLGLSERSQIFFDATLAVFVEKANAVYRDINETVAFAAS